MPLLPSNNSHYVVRLVDHTLALVLIALMVGMTINVLWQVASRYIFNDPSSYTEELARFMLIWLALLGGAYSFRRGSNISFDLITEQLPAHLKKHASLAALIIVMFFTATVMVYGGISLMLLTLKLKQSSAALQIPMGIVYFAIPLSGSLISFYCIVNLLDHLRSPVQAKQGNT